MARESDKGPSHALGLNSLIDAAARALRVSSEVIRERLANGEVIAW